MIVLSIDNVTEIADLESLGDTTVGTIMHKGDVLSYQTVLTFSDFFNCVLRKYLIVDRMYRVRRNPWQALCLWLCDESKQAHV